MQSQKSEKSDESSCTSVSPIAAFLKRGQIWPGWYKYLVVVLVNATATALLFPVIPVERGYISDEETDLLLFIRCAFSALMLASFGSGCVAVYLVKRARASAHVRSASGYAMINWLQSIVASTSLPSDYYFQYGLMECCAVPSVVIICRGLLYLIASFWMQKLIASRLVHLEQSSNQKYCSGFVRRLLCAQACGAILTAISLCGVVFLRISGKEEKLWAQIGHRIEDIEVFLPASLASLTACINVVANAVAACSLAKSFLELRRLLRLAGVKEAPVAAKSSLIRAKKYAALQVMGVSFSLVLTVLVVPVAVFGAYRYSTYNSIPFQVLNVFVQVCDFLGNAVAVLILSGSYRLTKADQAPIQRCQPLACHACLQTRRAHLKEPDWSPRWKARVEELSLRGMTLRSLLQFYEQLFSLDWSYSAQDHKTRDVVRRAIIPLTSTEECAFAASSWNRNGAQRAQVMVTHSWGNSFMDLLAAVVSDALSECSFRMAAGLLEEDCRFISQILAKSGRLDDTYWICAFAVNQHISICHSNPYDRDPITNELHPVCSCSCVNISDPDGRSTSSEINKFDDMMYHLATTGICRQVIAVDKSLDLFHRAWCVAEIAEANRLDMTQSLQLLSKVTRQQRARTLEGLDVRSMQASSQKDKELILGKIGNIDEFNTELQALIFNPTSGLVASWNAMDAVQQVGEVGRLIRWGLADAGTGKVWKAWEAYD